jgi:hypothetical protein
LVVFAPFSRRDSRPKKLRIFVISSSRMKQSETDVKMLQVETRNNFGNFSPSFREVRCAGRSVMASGIHGNYSEMRPHRGGKSAPMSGGKAGGRRSTRAGRGRAVDRRPAALS